MLQADKYLVALKAKLSGLLDAREQYTISNDVFIIRECCGCVSV